VEVERHRDNNRGKKLMKIKAEINKISNREKIRKSVRKIRFLKLVRLTSL
jgi:hypothetical protein